MFDRTIEPLTTDEVVLATRIRAVTDRALRPFDPLMVAHTATTAGHTRSFPGSFPSIRSRQPAALLLLATLVGLVVLGGLLALVGAPSRLDRSTRFIPGPERPILFVLGGQVSAYDDSSGQTMDLGPGSTPVWSPDGSHIAFQQGSEVLLMDPTGSNRRRLTDQWGYGLAWSPGGDEILGVSAGTVTSNGSFVVVRADGTGSRVLPVSPYKDSGNGSWAPDGTRVAVVTQAGIEVVPLASSEPHRASIASNSGAPWLVRWSQDGSVIAYDASDGIHLVAPDGSGDRLLVPLDRFAVALEWSPDGRSLAYATERDRDAWVVDVLTNQERKVFTAPDGRQPIDVKWSRAGSTLAVAVGQAFSDPSTDASVWIVGLNDGAAVEAIPHIDRSFFGSIAR